MFTLGEIHEHLLINGIDKSYTHWIFHGESLAKSNEKPSSSTFDDQSDDEYLRMEELVNDAFRNIGEHADTLMDDLRRNENCHEDLDAERYKALFDDARQSLYPSCPRELTKLSVTVELYSLKARNGWSDNSFNDLLQLVKKLLSVENTLPLNGVTTYDSHLKTIFNLKAILMWGIHDFPAYGSLSGCVTHAQYACPVCAEGTIAERLKSGKKYSYQGHRRFLPINHVFRTQKAAFNNKVEEGRPSHRLSGSEVEAKVIGIQMDIGKSKGKKRKSYGDDSTGNITAWYKRSILFDLPYWKELPVRHNLDVMHVIKNVGDHLLLTILEVKDKAKDDISACEDLKKMNIMKDLWLKEADGKTIKPKAPFTLSRKEKELFCQTLHDLKVPTRHSSRFKHLVNLQTLEIKD
ncbi:uncharacterized protein LOC131234619 [Magnolia sinica]|uniref:uncharacterized protein LOC131234619 n=1 Tax=Magnolia sinica TaxID=86752 RepID=UPI002659C562|nr:uncharacterized protein LOC131234619 [Magnolia sinica]